VSGGSSNCAKQLLCHAPYSCVDSVLPSLGCASGSTAQVGPQRARTNPTTTPRRRLLQVFLHFLVGGDRVRASYAQDCGPFFGHYCLLLIVYTGHLAQASWTRVTVRFRHPPALASLDRGRSCRGVAR
jgi:hypothetical protein